MMPDNELSSIPITGQLLVTDPQPTPLISRQRGGVGYRDASQGVNVKVWTCTLVNEVDVVIYAGDVAPIVLFSGEDITQLSLAFDQNMNAFVAFVQAGQAKYYWYDSLIEQQIISNLPVGATYPRATLDDHRMLETAHSDIIMVYLLNGNLYFRMQRDRYLVQRLLYADLNLVVIAPVIRYIGMNDKNRLQIMIQGAFFNG